MLLAALAVVAWLLPYGLSSYAIHVVDVALIFAVLAIGLGLAMGVGGQINLAQVAFFGVGAYATAILTTHAGLGFWPAAVLAVARRTADRPARRHCRRCACSRTTSASSPSAWRSPSLNWVTNAPLAGGAEGISAIPVPPMFGVDLSSEYLYYYLELVVFAAALAFGLFVVRTPLGRRMRAMRDDPLAAGAVGAEVPLLRMTAFLLASVYGGLAGVLYAGLIRYVAPDSFSIANMFLLLAMVIIGGRQSLVGCVIGAIGLSLVREVLTDFADLRAARVRRGGRAHGGLRADRAGRASRPERAAWRTRRRGDRPAPSLRPSTRTSRVARAPPDPARSWRSTASPSSSAGCKALDDVSLTVTPGRSGASSAPTAPARPPCST